MPTTSGRWTCFACFTVFFHVQRPEVVDMAPMIYSTLYLNVTRYKPPIKKRHFRFLESTASCVKGCYFLVQSYILNLRFTWFPPQYHK